VNTEASDVNRITLRDGRTLAYAEYGDPDGKPVFYFHGTPGSRLEHHPDDAIARERGVRIITADRPGYGHSDFQPHRTAPSVSRIRRYNSMPSELSCSTKN
jgi:pimeloyl-ACP methyl ester carboxylesterase